MSLETQIAALVTASNSLTAAINGKITEINAKVKQATDSVPSVVRSLARQYFYIDAVNGDDNNDGTSAKPLKTASAAQSRAVNGGVVELRFKGGQTHACDFFFETGRIVCTTYGEASSAAADRAVIAPALVSTDANGTRMVRAMGVTSGPIYFSNINLLCHYEGGGPFDPASGFIRYTNSQSQCTLRNVELTLGNVPFARIYLGYSQRDVSLSGVTIKAFPGYESTAKIIGSDEVSQQATVRLEVRNVILSGITGGWAQMMPIRGVDNYHTNMEAW